MRQEHSPCNLAPFSVSLHYFQCTHETKQVCPPEECTCHQEECSILLLLVMQQHSCPPWSPWHMQRYSIPLPITLHQMMSEAGKQRLAQLQQPYGGYNDRVVLTFDQAREIFDCVVDPICKKVAELQRKCRRNGRGFSQVLLTGGFGSSPYLQDKLRQMCVGVDIVCPPWGYAATMTGEECLNARGCRGMGGRWRLF